MRFTRGFHRRSGPDADPARVPPGQYVTNDFPVLSAGPTPHTRLADWTFTLRGLLDTPISWTWDQLRALPNETVTVDIHCVTKWSKLGTVLDRRLARHAARRRRDGGGLRARLQ